MNKEQFYLALEKENIVLNETQKQQFNDYYQLIYQTFTKKMKFMKDIFMTL